MMRRSLLVTLGVLTIAAVGSVGGATVHASVGTPLSWPDRAVFSAATAAVTSATSAVAALPSVRIVALPDSLDARQFQSAVAAVDGTSTPRLRPRPRARVQRSPGGVSPAVVAVLGALLVGTWVSVGASRLRARAPRGRRRRRPPPRPPAAAPSTAVGRQGSRQRVALPHADAGCVPLPKAYLERPGALESPPDLDVIAIGQPSQARVRSVLAPEGYVEIRGCLVRATWVGAGIAPRPGRAVSARVVHGAIEATPATASGLTDHDGLRDTDTSHTATRNR
jgi:hypothetical protein